MPNPTPATGEAMSARAADPLLSTIREYREGCKAYADGLTEDDLDGDEALFEQTYGPQMRTLTAWSDPATRPEGAIEALRLIKEERMLTEPMGIALVDAVIGFLEGWSASEPDPLLTAITNYRNGSIALNSVPDEFISQENEQEIFDVVYRPHVNVLRDEAPAATTLAGVREAIQMVFDEDALDDVVVEGVLRAALAYFDGKAVQ